MSMPGIATENLDFGRVRLGRDRCLPLRVWNTGDDVLELKGFSVQGGEFTAEALDLSTATVHRRWTSQATRSR